MAKGYKPVTNYSLGLAANTITKHWINPDLLLYFPFSHWKLVMRYHLHKVLVIYTTGIGVILEKIWSCYGYSHGHS